MTEITRVPLQPIAKGSLSKLWLGVFAAALGGAAIAGLGKPALVDVKTLTAGAGATPTTEDLVMINYKGRLANGTVFDQQNHSIMPVQGVVPGFAKALMQMQKGGKYVVKIPAKLGYGDHQVGPIPPNSDLVFDVELIDFHNRAEIERQQRMFEQLRQMQAQRKADEATPDAPPAQ